jgi:hypothetical protein
VSFDFDRLVLAPCQAIFGKAATVLPFKSQPGAAPYIARGIWNVRAINIAMEDGAILSSQTNRLSIRISEFPTALLQGDYVILDQLPEQLGTALGGTSYVFDDDDPDGQGATDVTLKQQALPA